MPDPSSPLSSPEILAAPSAAVWVVPRPRHRYWLHALLLGLTFLTTLTVGSRMQFNFAQGAPAFSANEDFFPVLWIFQQPSRLLLGVPFSFCLMLILLAHEMGHYLYCVRYRVYATLPFFIPAPTLIGTLGAFIRIKSPIPSRRALFDIAVAGPIAGFVVALVTLAISLALSKPLPAGAPESQWPLNYSLVFDLVHRLVPAGPAGPAPLARVLLHPMAVASWMGMFATALNLLPGGQLDGGHIVFALTPRLHRWVSTLTFGALVVMAWWWGGWLLWAVLLMVSGMRHPQIGTGYRSLLGFGTDAVQEHAWAPLGTPRRVLAIAALAMLALTFLPAPFPGAGLAFHWPWQSH